MKSFITVFVLILSIVFPHSGLSQVIKDGEYYIFAKSSAYVIDNDHSNIRNGNNIHLWDLNETKAQQWKVVNRNGGIVIMSQLNNNYVIDNDHSRIANGNNIQLWEYNGSNAQIWYPENIVNDTFVLRSAINRNYVIDNDHGRIANGNNIQLWEYNGSDAQKWVFKKVSDVEDSEYEYMDWILDILIP